MFGTHANPNRSPAPVVDENERSASVCVETKFCICVSVTLV